MKNLNLSKILLGLNIFAILYFITLAVISYFSYENTIFNAIAELITLPLIFFLVFSLGYSIYELVKKHWSKMILVNGILSLSSIVFLIILTANQM